MSTLEFALPDGSTRAVRVARLFNAGYTGRAQDEVAKHVAELVGGVDARDRLARERLGGRCGAGGAFAHLLLSCRRTLIGS